MKHLQLILLLAASLLMSCSPATTEIWFYEDGSGKARSTTDMAEYFDMIGPMINNIGSELGGEQENMDISDQFFSQEEEDMDSTIVIYDVMPDSVKQLLDYPDLMKKITMRIVTNSEQKEAKLYMTVDFDSVEEYNAIEEEIHKSTEGDAQSGMMDQEALSGMFESFMFDPDKKEITIKGGDMRDLIESEDMSFLSGKLDSLEYLADDSMEKMMIEMILGSDMDYIIYAPGRITDCIAPECKINGNKASFTVKMLETLKSGIVEDILIKYE